MGRSSRASGREVAAGASPGAGRGRRMERVYAGLLVAGVVLPLAQFVPWLAAHGLDLRRFVADLFANRIGGFFGWDVFVAVAVIVVAAGADRELRPAQRWLVAAGALGGASIGLPLYLLLRERARGGEAWVVRRE